jgi:hypothetical protein
VVVLTQRLHAGAVVSDAGGGGGGAVGGFALYIGGVEACFISLSRTSLPGAGFGIGQALVLFRRGLEGRHYSPPHGIGDDMASTGRLAAAEGEALSVLLRAGHGSFQKRPLLQRR